MAATNIKGFGISDIFGKYAKDNFRTPSANSRQMLQMLKNLAMNN